MPNHWWNWRRARFGGLDIAFNNAGANGEMGPTSGVSIEGWREALDVNLTGAFLGAKYQIPAMQRRGGGSLIFTSTFVGHTVGMPGTAAYAASKAGVIGLMKTLAAELGPQGIRVECHLARRHSDGHGGSLGRYARKARLCRGIACT